VAAHSEACIILPLERWDVGLTSPGGHGCISHFFVFALSGVGRRLAIAQLSVVVSEVDSEWKQARSANPNVLLSKKKERSFLESGHLKPRELYRTMTLWQMLVKSVLKMGRGWTLLRILFIGELCYLRC
jgi:hypothetical protein